MPNLAKIKKERLKNDIRIGIWIHPDPSLLPIKGHHVYTHPCVSFNQHMKPCTWSRELPSSLFMMLVIYSSHV
jgi:hypothetical protein